MELKGNLYDDIDMRNAYSTGFWVGAISSGLLTLAMCFFVGYLVL